MYLRRLDYEYCPKYNIDSDYILEHANKIRAEFDSTKSYSREIIRHFMKIRLYSYCYGIDHWVQELAYNYVTQAPIVKPRNKIMSSSLIKKALNNPAYLKDYKIKKTFESLLKQYKKFDPRTDYEYKFTDRFKELYNNFITKFSNKLVEVTEDDVELEESDITDILDDLGLSHN